METKICRLCSQHEANSYIFLKDPNIIDLCTKIMHCCSKVEIKEGDGLPSFVCESCEQELELCYQFVLKCETSDRYLRSQLLARDIQVTSICTTPINGVKTEIKYESDYENHYEDSHIDHTQEESLRKLSHFNLDRHIFLVDENTEMKLKNVDDPFFSTPLDNNVPFIQLCQDTIVGSRKHRPNKKSITYKNTRPWKCSECDRECISQSALVIHMRVHRNEYPFQCSLCDKKYKDAGNLKRHITKHNSIYKKERKFICESCGKGFFTSTDVKIHMRTHTKETPFPCRQCSAKFTQRGALQRHEKRHFGEKDHLCSNCPKRFYTKEELKRHLSVHSTEKKYKCSICNTLFKHLCNFRKHRKLHLESSNFDCNYCGKNFKLKGSLKLHIKRQHSEKAGFCKLCSRHANNLEVHMWKHTGERPLRCDLCTSTFYELRGLAHHMNIKHTNTDRYKCDVKGCSKMFPSRSMLEFHIVKFHSKKISFPCDQCSRGFYRKSDLARHKNSTHKEQIV